MAAKNEWADKDYYGDLGVSSTATDADIKKAYRKLARENHPDSHPGDTAREERFKQVAEAYDVLGDEAKRKEYDEFKAMIRAGGGFSGGFRGGTQFQDFSDIFGTGASSGGFSDIFGSSWGGNRRQARPKRGSDVETEITIDFREAAKGTDRCAQELQDGNARLHTCRNRRVNEPRGAHPRRQQQRQSQHAFACQTHQAHST